MNEKFIKYETATVLSQTVTTTKECSEAEATHIHVCYHDEDPPRSCYVKAKK